jgi:hypothetical protein
MPWSRPSLQVPALVVVVLGVQFALVALAGCGQGSDEFDSEAYCDAIAAPDVQLDAKAMIDGDEQALKDAQSVYQSLKDLGPPELSSDWSLIVRELGSMVKAAGGSVPVEEVDYQAFTDAFTAIELDKHDRCGK